MANVDDSCVRVMLRRKTSDQPWGFRMVGGKDQDCLLHIAKVNPRSLADRCGLRPGDAVLMIEQLNATSIFHDRAKAEILRAGNDLRLVVKRGAVTVRDEEPQDMRRSMVLEEVTEYRGDPNPTTQSRTFHLLNQFLAEELSAMENETAEKLTTVNGPARGTVFASGPEGPKTQTSGSMGGLAKDSASTVVEHPAVEPKVRPAGASTAQSGGKAATGPSSKPAESPASKTTAPMASKPAETKTTAAAPAGKPAQAKTTAAPTSKPAETKTTATPVNKPADTKTTATPVSKPADTKTAVPTSKPADSKTAMEAPVSKATATPAQDAPSTAKPAGSPAAASSANKAPEAATKGSGGDKDVADSPVTIESSSSSAGPAAESVTMPDVTPVDKVDDYSEGPESDYSDDYASESSEGATFTIQLS